MKMFIIVIILAVIAIFFYVNPNIIGDVKQYVKNSERCAEFNISKEEKVSRGYGFGIKKILKGCF